MIISTHTRTVGTWWLSDLPDPLGCYTAVIAQYGMQEYTVIALNICDGNSVLIEPHEYQSKLKIEDVVMLEYQLKL